MIYAILMAGGRGTRLEVPCEKPLFKLKEVPLIKYVLDNLNQSKLIDKIIIAVSPNTCKTTQYLKSLDYDFEILDTSGKDYLTDLSYVLDYFEKKSKDDTLLFINADLPFICAETIDDVLNHYFKSDKDALSVLVPVEIFEELGLDYSYEFDGNVPSGLNILRSENIIQEESNIVIPKVELALNINTLLDSKVAEKLYNEYYI
ncbi:MULTISPECIES: NTP transferase domain-containing protein [Methanobrevibacter]|uniref:NTP transferase domain-containing protein n=1 Tax=Methanobrevibacter TaxID=2172 RepID=UPI0015BD9142|nr:MULTISPECIES: NTP transferase domain-containing protein [Methanobrevibacter]MBS7256946.1 NTP transferase domain-containing protein [Methanobrevibacter sp.]MCI7427954.1 NTP transferase domain-containing protein [Methanobrevibacter sp.]MDD6776291.1 NTP transferase domain-containing protein [Methanobacteriaceae archaeon]MDY3096953.1 NTP transferase domain-containing protein [Methanobrevibacter sp.]